LEADEGVLVESTADGDDGFFSSFVEDKLRHTDAAHANHVILTVSRDRSRDPGDPKRQKQIVERYDVSARGEHPVCMTVTGRRAGRFTTVYKTPPGFAPDYYWRLSVEVADGSC
jgi:hypothetical protein